MNELKQASQNIQGLIDAAVKKGLFENAQTVIAIQQSLNALLEAATKNNLPG